MTNKEIKELMQDFDKSNLAFLKITNGDFTVKMKKATQTVVAMPTPSVQQSVAATPTVTTQEEQPTQQKTNQATVKAPLVGVFYKSPAPDAKPFVAVGDKVKKGDVVCLIEAMKMINEIKAPVSGTVTEVLVADGDLVSFDQAVMQIEE